MECRVCGCDNLENAIVCKNCGEKFAKRCKFCGTIMALEDTVCSNCKLTVEEKPCKCGNVLNKKDSYCSACGKIKAPKIFQIISAWAIVAVLFIMSIASFLPIISLKAPTALLQGNANKLPSSITVKISAIDLLSVPVNLIKHKSMEEVGKEFADYLIKNPPKFNMQNATEAQMTNYAISSMENFGILRIMCSSEFMDYNTGNMIWLIVSSLLMWALLICMLVFFGITLTKTILLTKDSTKIMLKFNGTQFAVPMILALAVPLFMGGSLGAGSMLIAMFGILGLVWLFIKKALTATIKKDVRQIVFNSFGVFASVIAMLFIGMKGLSFQMTMGSVVIEGDVKIADLIGGIAAMHISNALSPLHVLSNTALLDLLKQLNGNMGGLSQMLFYPVQFFSFKETLSFTSVNIAVGFLALFGSMVCIAGIASSFVYALKDFVIKSKRNLGLLFAILAFCGALVLLTCNIIVVVSANSVVKQLSIEGLKYSIGLAPIVLAVFSLLLFVTAIIRSAIDRTENFKRKFLASLNASNVAQNTQAANLFSSANVNSALNINPAAKGVYFNAAAAAKPQEQAEQPKLDTEE